MHRATSLGRQEILSIVRYLCSVAHLQKIFFLWRPGPPDPKDDMVLELAVASRARYIVTFNDKHFAAAGRFGTAAM